MKIFNLKYLVANFIICFLVELDVSILEQKMQDLGSSSGTRPRPFAVLSTD